ncbi:MAG: tetratricopeptide repeat protein [Chthoniobacterales bacterium]|nr:tetratricopeptide repeat protein [Chthoniobacterales bacterium]
MKTPPLFYSAAVAFFVFASSLGATPLEDALRPLSDGVPEVAVVRLQQLLTQKLAPSEQQLAQSKLLEALARAGRPEEALKIAVDPSLTKDWPAQFWKAQALAALGRWSEAEPAYAQVAAAADAPLRADAAFGEAQSLRALGRRDDALRVLRPLQQDALWQVRASLGIAALMIEQGDLVGADRLLRAFKMDRPADRQERRFLFGKIQLEQGRYDRAAEILAVILQQPADVPHPLLIATLFAIADTHLRGKTPERGDDVLEDFIEHHSADAALPEVFAKLDELYQAEQKPSPNELARWTRERTEPRRALAQWYLARSQLRAGEREAALRNLTNLRTSAAQLPSLGEAQFELARLLFADRKWDEAIAAGEAAKRLDPMSEVGTRAAWLIAEANYRAGRLEAAAPIFEQVAKDAPAFASDALFNAALCWLRIEQADKFSSDYRRISDDPTKQSSQSDLLLEEGMVQAAQGKAEAAEALRKFIHDFPNNARLAEAWVALAELAFHEQKPDLAGARAALAQARQSNPTANALERADYLDIWLNDAAETKDESQVIAAASAFLQHHPGSPFTAEVRMKLAEAYFRRQDFANAQTQFELLAQQDPDASLTEKALFFAARSAMSSMGAASLDHALALLDQVVKLNGDLKWAARNEEAAIERRLGKNEDAIAIYDEVLKNSAKPPEQREALCGKADVLYEMGATDPQNYRRAIELYQQLAEEPGVPAHWRNQAGFKKGKALEKSNDKPAALTTYYSVLEQGAQPERQHEFFWFYKAGFSAAHLLEEASDWKSAVAVYRKLAAVNGARSDEAKTRLTQLRMEHFLWDE